MRLAKQSILYFLADVGTSVVGFVATVYFARTLGSGPLGQYFIVIALMGWLTIPTNGMASAVNKRISEGGSGDALLSTATALGISYGVVVASLVMLAESYVNAYVGAEVSLLFASLLVVNIVFTMTVEGIKGQQRVATAGVLRTTDRVLRVGAQIGLIYLGYEFFGLIAGHLLSIVGATLIGAAVFNLRPRFPDRNRLRSLVDYGRYAWLGNMKSKTFGWMDTLILGLFVAPGLIGVYEVSWRIASILILVSNAVEHTLFPAISDISSEQDEDEIQQLLGEAMFYAGIFVIPGFFGVLILGPKILRIYGSEFVKGAPILLILIFARTVNVYEMQMLNVINAVDRPDIAFRINIVFILTNVFLNVVLISQFGWFGAAVATSASSLAMLLLSWRALAGLVGKPPMPLRGIGQQIFASIVMAVVLAVTRQALPIENMYVTVGLTFFGASVYGGVLYVLSARVRTKVRSLAAV